MLQNHASWFKTRVVVCLMLIVLLDMACAPENEGGFDWQEVESFIGATIPATATDKQAAWEQGIDDLLMLRMTLPVTDTQAFLQNLGFEVPLQENYRSFSVSVQDQDWWNIESLLDTASGSISRGNKTIEVVTTAQDGDLMTLYIVAFER